MVRVLPCICYFSTAPGREQSSQNILYFYFIIFFIIKPGILYVPPRKIGRRRNRNVLLSPHATLGIDVFTVTELAVFKSPVLFVQVQARIRENLQDGAFGPLRKARVINSRVRSGTAPDSSAALPGRVPVTPATLPGDDGSNQKPQGVARRRYFPGPASLSARGGGGARTA